MMQQNLNVLPEGKALPEVFGEERPVHLHGGMIPENATEVIYKVLCKSGKYIDLPASALVDIKKADAKK